MNALIKLSDILQEIPTGTNGRPIAQILSFNNQNDQAAAAENIALITDLFEQGKSQLLRSKLPLEMKKEYLSTLEGHRKSFLRACLGDKDVNFFSQFRPHDKAANIRVIGHLIGTNSESIELTDFDRPELLKDILELRKALDLTEVPSFVKATLILHFNSVQALLEVGADIDERALRSEVRSLTVAFVACFDQLDAKESDFSERFIQFVKKNVERGVMAVALLPDLSDGIKMFADMSSGG